MIKIIPKHDTLKRWEIFNPIIRLNELCAVLMPDGECKWKLGDGIHKFIDLDYINRISDISIIMVYRNHDEPIMTFYINPDLYDDYEEWNGDA